MKHINLIILMVLALNLFAQSETPTGLKSGNKRALPSQFWGQEHSRFLWDDLDLENWLSFQDWRSQFTEREQYGNWRLKLMQFRNNELVGRVFKCIGICELNRRNGTVVGRPKSPIREGDEVRTKKDSYLLVYLMDGSVFQVSPETSVTFSEINIANKETVIVVRLNMGHILWLSRLDGNFEQSNHRETAAIYLPPSSPKAKRVVEDKYDPKNLELFISDDVSRIKHSAKLNKLVAQNKKLHKTNYGMVIMPNGTFIGPQLNLEIFYSIGNKAIVKNRKPSFYYNGFAHDIRPVKFFYRGYNNEDSFELRNGMTYEVDERGRNIRQRDSVFDMSEALTKRMPSIFIQRELWVQRYSAYLLLKDLDEKVLGKRYGYWKWENLSESGSNLARRVGFLLEYSRRIETTHLSTIKRFQKKYPGEKITPYDSFDKRFYRKALNAYLERLAKEK